MKGFIYFFKTRPPWIKAMEFAMFLWLVLLIEYTIIDAYYEDRTQRYVNEACSTMQESASSQARTILSRNPEDQSARDYILRKP